MKKVFLISLLVPVITFNLLAQSKHEMGNKEKMQLFSAWKGDWHGEASTQMGPGTPKKSVMTEHIESKLDGMILTIEGIGKSIDETTKKENIVHHAFAVLSYDNTTNQYKLRSYLKDGQSTEGWFNVVGENKYMWGFETKGGKIRFNISLDPVKKTWNEIGEFSPDGDRWMKFLEMNLTKSN